MKLQIVSDIHFEFGNKIKIIPGAPYLCVLGDVGNPFDLYYEAFFREQSEQFDKVFIVIGNHEYYFSDDADVVVKKIRSICESFSNVFLLDRDVYRISDETLLIGCTMWSRITEYAAAHINDFKMIGVNGDSALDRETYLAWHERDVMFLNQTIRDNSDMNIIVLTHHAPSNKLQKMYASSLVKSAFATDLEYMLREPVKAWAYGHLHCNEDVYINGVRCVSNCLGYPHERDVGYDDAVTIEFM
jgi:predicted phosphodiesterase